jgi:hypothetical protein
MTSNEQLTEWLKGNSLCPNDRGECCPDFSCCSPTLLADKKSRRVFVDGDEETRHGFLGIFPGKAMEEAMRQKNLKKKIYISGVEIGPDQTLQ